MASFLQADSLLGRATDRGEKLQGALRAAYDEDDIRIDSHPRARMASKVAVIIISALGDIPFISVSLPLGKVLGPICAAGNCATFFILDYWSAQGMINQAFGAKTAAEIELAKGEETREKYKICKKVAFAVAAFSIILLSQIPMALAAMEYNEERYKVAAALVLLIAGPLLPLRSLQLSFEQIALKMQNAEEAQIKAIKGKLIDLLRSCQDAFVQKSPEEKAVFIRSCQECLDRSLIDDQTEARLLALVQPVEIAASSESEKKIRQVFGYGGLALGFALTLLFEYASADYAFVQTKDQVYDNNSVGGVFAALTVVSKVYLTGLSIMKTSERIFNVCGNLITGKEIRNLSWQLRPKLSAALTALGLGINITGMGPNYLLWGDFYSGNAAEHGLFQAAVCTALFLLFFTATLDTLDDVVASSLSKGTEEEQKILRIIKEFKETIKLVEMSSSSEFLAYLRRPFQKALLERMGMTQDQLPLPSRESSYGSTV